MKRSWFAVLFGGPDRSPAGLAAVPCKAYLEAWNAPCRRDALKRAAALLSELGSDEARDLVWGVARRLFSYVLDLPASEKHHHSGPYGLFDHSIEVAEMALRASLSRYFAADTRAYPEEQEYRVPRLRYAAWLFGLLHDSGKVAHFDITAPGQAQWNPFVETLEAFLEKHGPDRCRRAWRKGRGLDVHTWHNAYVISLFLSGPVSLYLGSKLTRELLEQKEPAAAEVLALVADGDHRSSDQDRAQGDRPPVPVASDPRILVGGGDLAARIPDVLQSALSSGDLHANTVGGDLFVGSRFVLVRYPAAVQKLGILIRTTLGKEYAQARVFTASESGAREFAGFLHDRRALFSDRETDSWKIRAKIQEASGYDLLEGILVERTFLEPAFRNSALFEGVISVVRASDERALPIEDWKAIPKAEAPAARPVAADAPKPPPSRSPRAKPPAPQPDPVTAPVLSLPASPPIVAVRKFISPEVLFEDIRQAILGGTIPSNQWSKPSKPNPCFVLEAVTYLVSPRGFTCLVEKGLYTRDPKREVNVYLDALAAIPAVRKQPGGKVLTRISVRPGARPLWVVAFDTQGLFKDAREIAQVGYWTESPIRELSDEEANAANSPPLPLPEVAGA